MLKRLLQGLLCVALLGATWYDAKAATTPEYFIHFQPKQVAGLLVTDDVHRQWSSLWVAHKEGFVEWLNPDGTTGSGREYEQVRNGYLTITAFDQWTADCRKAVLEDINTGARTELQCQAGTGHYYIPWLVPQDPVRIRIWGVIAGGPKRFYWEADFYPNEKKLNNCWYEGPKTADVIRQQEVWYDDGGGWIRGTGTAAWNAQGQPIIPQTVKQWEATIAKGYGVWTLQDLRPGGPKYCEYSRWDWN
jgi:hypothetical protein